MRKINLYLTERQYACLEEDAYQSRRSLSEIIRALVTREYKLAPESVRPGVSYRSPEADAKESRSPFTQAGRPRPEE